MPVATESLPLRPPLKWAGGKRWQVPLLQPLWEPHAHRRLVEPFCGGLAVALGLMPERALLNDLNPHLINFYRWLQKGLTIDIPLRHSRTAFYANRKRFNALLERDETGTREAAALFYYLNRTGYNGLCRFNRDGRFNVPFGQYAAIKYRRDFSAYREALTGWRFSCADIADVPLESGDFVYADPPYDVTFTHYSRGGFRWEDQVRTAELLAKHRGPVILVNQSTERTERLYHSLGYSVSAIQGPRRINCTGDRTPATELIATRNL